MPVSNTSFIRSTLVLMAICVLGLVGFVGATAWSAWQTSQASQSLLDARLLRSSLTDLKSLLQDAETGQRGFLLSEDPAYLGPYEEARSKLAAAATLVRSRLDADPALADGFNKLSGLIDAKLAELAKTIDLARDGRRQEAIQIFGTDRGRKLMDAARGQFADLVAATDERIGLSIGRQQSSLEILLWVSFIAAGVILAGGTAAAIVVAKYTRDLTKAHVEIELLNESLDQKVEERTAELGRANQEIQRFAYIVTHDLRAPLVNIMGFTSEVETSVKPIQSFIQETRAENPHLVPEEAYVAAVQDLPEAVSFIRSSTSKMDGLINAILKLSREGRRVLRPETVKLDSILQACVAAIQHQLLEANAEVTIEPSGLSVVSDRLVLEQVFGNLLDNAVKYRSSERALTIRIWAKKQPGPFIAVTVQDNARGIAQQDLERVFELFRRSGPQNQPGEGIGLAHVRSMIRNLGGDISVESELGAGSTFRVLIPQRLAKNVGAN